MTIEIIPAILVKSREELMSRLAAVSNYVKTVQIDVMDGKFVPNTTIGADDLKDLPSGIQYEFHWMVSRPQEWIRKIKGPHIHIPHAEALQTIDDFKEVFKAVEESGGRLGIAINPETSLEKILPFMDKFERVLIMTVHPGFDKQKYIAAMETKIARLRSLFPKLDIEVDGGINIHTIGAAVSAGANKLAAASAIFSVPDVKNAITGLAVEIKQSLAQLRPSTRHGAGYD
ncbi:MAG: ribulose-phosphate 3-epimerase [Candidatus Micrarchaeota archaeon]